MKLIRDLIRITLGATFIFSGFVKGIDPLGSTYKFTDYFSAFGTEWANGMAFGMAVILSIIEFGMGLALVVNYRTKLFSLFTLIFMAFFLPLTLFIAIENPVSDCGCFGDALIITNWETFYKNIVLSAMAVFVFIHRKKYNNKFNIVFQNLYFLFFLLLFMAIQNHSYHHLPIIDFRPYKVGNNIIELMEVPEDAPVDEYETFFIYRNLNSGEEVEFDESNYPWQDTENWEYVDANSVLVKKGYHPPISNFFIENEYGENVSDYFLYDPGYTFIMVSHSLAKANYRNRFNKIANDALDAGMNFICLTASSPRDIEDFIEEYNPPYEFFFCDEITLKTIIRSNPGLVLLSEGTIIDKWHRNDIPKFRNINFE